MQNLETGKTVVLINREFSLGIVVSEASIYCFEHIEINWLKCKYGEK